MKNYSPADLRAILRHSLNVIGRARASRKWPLLDIKETDS
jgi:hypothetical protein